jgi:hypothetical protein
LTGILEGLPGVQHFQETAGEAEAGHVRAARRAVGGQDPGGAAERFTWHLAAHLAAPCRRRFTWHLARSCRGEALARRVAGYGSFFPVKKLFLQARPGEGRYHLAYPVHLTPFHL